MADLTAQSTGGAGLGSRPTRWGIVTVWALNLIHGLMAGVLGPGAPAHLWAAFAAGLVGTLLLTREGGDRLGPWRAVGVVVCAVATATAITGFPEMTPMMWIYYFSAYLPALLIARGNVRMGVVGGVLVLAVGLGWAARVGSGLPGYLNVVAIPLSALLVGVLWQLMFRRAVGREVAHRGEAARSGLARRAHEEALARSRRELAQIELEARPLLERLAAGEPIDDGVRADLEVAEATIRDRIRSPLLQHPALTPELARLRRGGVHVLLLGEVPDDGGPHEPMAGPLAAAVVRELADAEPGGSVVIRRLPDGGAVSVVVRGASTTRQVQLSVDGTVLARR